MKVTSLCSITFVTCAHCTLHTPRLPLEEASGPGRKDVLQSRGRVNKGMSWGSMSEALMVCVYFMMLKDSELKGKIVLLLLEAEEAKFQEAEY